MSEFDAIIDFGSDNLRIGVFDSQSKSIYNSKISIREALNNKDANNHLNKLIRDVVGDILRDIWLKRNAWK